MLKIPVVEAQRFVRRMCGQTRAQLIRAADGQCYVVKYTDNPMGRRVLVNELISAFLLKALDIRTPEIALVAFDTEGLKNNPEIGIPGTYGMVPVSPGLHFGSRYPAAPKETSVYDFFPDKLLPWVWNLKDFNGAMVFDKWVSNADRQAIFFREAAYETEGGARQTRWIVEMIGHSSTFQGKEWTFRSSPPLGLYPRLNAYGSVATLRDFEPWLDKIADLSADLFESLMAVIPERWISGEEQELKALLGALRERTGRLPELLRESLVVMQAHREPRTAPDQDAPSVEECNGVVSGEISIR